MFNRGSKSTIGPLNGKSVASIQRHASCTQSPSSKILSSPSRLQHQLSGTLTYESKAVELERDLFETRKVIELLQKRIVELEGQLSSKVTKAKNSDHKILSEQIMTAREERDAAIQGFEKMKFLFEDLDRKFQAKEKMIDTFDARRQSEVDKLNNQLLESLSKLESSEFQKDALAQELEASNISLKKQEELMQFALMHVDKSQAEILYSQQMTRMTEQASEVETVRGERDKLLTENARYKEERKSFSESMAALKNHIAELEMNETKLKDSEREVRGLKAAASAAELARAEMVRRLENQAKKIEKNEMLVLEMQAKLHTATMNQNQKASLVALPKEFLCAPSSILITPKVPTASPIVEPQKLPQQVIDISEGNKQELDSKHVSDASSPGAAATTADGSFSNVDNLTNATRPNSVAVGSGNFPNQLSTTLSTTMESTVKSSKFRAAPGVVAATLQQQIREGSLEELKNKRVDQLAVVVERCRSEELSLTAHVNHLQALLASLTQTLQDRDQDVAHYSNRFLHAEQLLRERGTAEEFLSMERKRWDTETHNLRTANDTYKNQLNELNSQFQMARAELEAFRDVRDKLASLDLNALTTLQLHQQSMNYAVDGLVKSLQMVHTSSGTTTQHGRPRSTTDQAGDMSLGSTVHSQPRLMGGTAVAPSNNV